MEQTAVAIWGPEPSARFRGDFGTSEAELEEGSRGGAPTEDGTQVLLEGLAMPMLEPRARP